MYCHFPVCSLILRQATTRKAQLVTCIYFFYLQIASSSKVFSPTNHFSFLAFHALLQFVAMISLSRDQRTSMTSAICFFPSCIRQWLSFCDISQLLLLSMHMYISYRTPPWLWTSDALFLSCQDSLLWFLHAFCVLLCFLIMKSLDRAVRVQTLVAWESTLQWLWPTIIPISWKYKLS